MNDPFIASVDETGRITMKLSGNLNDDNFETLKKQIEAAKQLVKSESEKRGAKVPALFDLSAFTGTYNVGAMLAMKGLEEHNRPYLTKTAIYGGSPAAQVAAELTLALIHKDNLKIFPTRAEAEAWLSE